MYIIFIRELRKKNSVDVVNNMNNESVIPRNEFCIILGSNMNKIDFFHYELIYE